MISIDLSGKVAFITGGGQGLGFATATKLHAAGAAVVLNYFDDPSGANRTRAEASARELVAREQPGSSTPRAIALPADVRDRPAVIAALDETTRRRRRSSPPCSPCRWRPTVRTSRSA